MSSALLRRSPWFALAFAAVLAAQDPAPISVTLKDHRFDPGEIHVPANKPVLLEVANQDGQPEEFESHPMGVEKVVPPGAKVLVRIRPLKPGRYPFVGEYHEATAKGVVVAE